MFSGIAISLGAFDQKPACVSVTALGNCSLASLGARRFFAGNEPKEGHQLSGVFEAREVAEFAK